MPPFDPSLYRPLACKETPVGSRGFARSPSGVCGSTQFVAEVVVIFGEHRLKPEDRIAVPVGQRLVCVECGKVFNPDKGGANGPAE